MGGCLCGRKKDGRILLLGLDNAGKTTILRKLKLGDDDEFVPPGQTVGFNIENIPYNRREYCVWDVSGKEKVRPLWNRYFSDTLALVWVVDSSDLASLQVCKQEFKKVIREPDLHEAVILIYLNKQDLSSALFNAFPKIPPAKLLYVPTQSFCAELAAEACIGPSSALNSVS